MTNRNVTTPSQITGAFDFRTPGGSGLYRASEPLYAPKYHTWKVDDYTIGWEITIEDVRGGFDVYHGSYEYGHNKVYWATADCRHPRAIFLATLASTLAVTDFTSEVGIHHAQIGNSFAIGVGATANSALFTNTSTTDPAPSARTFTPTSAITGLWRVVLNNIQYIAIGRLTDPVYLISDLAATPTSPGTMHADTEPCWGIIPTPLPVSTGGFRILVYANGSIYNNLDTTSAIGAAPTASSITSIPNGGSAGGIVNLGGGGQRAYWNIPAANNASGDLAGSNLGRIMHCDLEGIDLQELKFPMRGIWAFAVWRDGIVATDGHQVFWHRGGQPINLRWAESRDPTIAAGGGPSYPFIAGFHVNHDQLGVQVVTTDTVDASVLWTESFDPETGRWSPRTRAIGVGAALTRIRPSGSYPYNTHTQVSYTAIGGASSLFQWQYIPSFGKRPNTVLRDLSGSELNTDGTASFEGFEDSGTWFGPFWELPGLEGWAKSVSVILHTGDMSDEWVSTTGTPLVRVRVTGEPITITDGVPQLTTTTSISREFGRTTIPVTQVQPIPGNSDSRGAFRVEIGVVRGTDTDRTPNGLPVVIRGFAYMPQWMRDMKPPAPILSLSESI